jgi:nucleoside-diphosphate kinase
VTTERTLIVVKPDGVGMRLVEKILEECHQEGLAMVGSVERFKFTRPVAEAFYAEHRERHYFVGTILFMTSGQSAAVILEGENAIARALQVKERVRSKYKSAGGPSNVIHTSDSPAAVDREIAMLFGDGD